MRIIGEIPALKKLIDDGGLTEQPPNLVFAAHRAKVPLDIDRRNAVVVCENLGGAGVMSSVFSQGFYHLVQSDCARFGIEASMAARMVKDPRFIFDRGSSAILGEVAHELVFPFRTSKEKDEVLMEISRELAKASIAANMAEATLRVCDELFTNVVYNAHGFVVERGQEASLPEGRSAKLVVAWNANYLLASTIDDLGNYVTEKAIFRVYDTFQRGMGASMNMGIGGAGIGCRMMFDLCSSHYLIVDAGKRSFVGYLIPIVHISWKQDIQRKNIHIAMIY